MIWIASFLLVGGYFGMYTEEVLIGSNSVGLFVWSQKCVLVHFGHMLDTWLDAMDSFIAFPLEQDESRPSLLFAGTSACIQKRSGLVPTVSVFSLGLENVFWLVPRFAHRRMVAT
jgi:hypothetical protein